MANITTIVTAIFSTFLFILSRIIPPRTASRKWFLCLIRIDTITVYMPAKRLNGIKITEIQIKVI